MNSRDKVRQVIRAFIGGSILLAIAHALYTIYYLLKENLP